MKTYQILLLDPVAKQIKLKIKNFKGTESELRLELLNLQHSYSENGDISVRKVKIMGTMCVPPIKLNIMIASCESDYCYMAVL